MICDKDGELHFRVGEILQLMKFTTLGPVTLPGRTFLRVSLTTQYPISEDQRSSAGTFDIGVVSEEKTLGKLVFVLFFYA